MDELHYTMGAIPGGYFRREFGRARFDGTKWWAEVNGKLLEARWADPVQPEQGSNIVVDISSDGQGLASAFVPSLYTPQPRPSTGTITVINSDGLLVLGAFGGAFPTNKFLGPVSGYAVGDPVRLDWSEGKPTVLSKIASVTVPAPPPAAGPAAGPATGYEVRPATATDTWGVGGWGRWATSQRGGEDVYTGSWNGNTVTGAWFYGAPSPALQGKTVTKILFRLPSRIGGAGSSGAVTLNLYAHNAQARPGGDVARVAGPYTVTVPAGYHPGVQLDPGAPPGHLLLPLSFAPALQGGGGVSIAGGSYAGYNSRLDDPESGKLIMDWKS